MSLNVDTGGLSVISEDRHSARKYHDGQDETDSVYNSRFRSGTGAKKKLHPLLGGPTRRDGKYISIHTASKSNLSEFTRRIMSAKLLKMNQLQNQLTETQIQLSEVLNENKILKNLQKRHEGALKKYEGNHAELPQLIRSHNEEIRALKNMNKNLKSQLRETNGRLKEKENEFETLKENYNKLKNLSEEKNLLDRDKLQKKVDLLQEGTKQQDEKMQVMARKMLLESKNFRHHLSVEVNKHKETQKELSNALSVISRLESQLLTKERQAAAAGTSRLPIKRLLKNTFPPITNKALEDQTNTANSPEDDFESPDSESELLGGVTSSSDSPSPAPDIFPDINRAKRNSTPLETSTDLFHFECELPRKPSAEMPRLSKRNSVGSLQAEGSAQQLVNKLTQSMDALSKDSKALSLQDVVPRDRLASLYDEIKSSVSKIEKVNTKVESSEPQDNRIKITDIKRNVPKRKLEPESVAGVEFTEPEPQKLINMTKTWNNIKNKIQEEREKAEIKLKNLCSSEGKDSEEEHDVEVKTNQKNGELLFSNFTSDEFIISELEKTDKIFRKLRNEKQVLSKSTSLGHKSKTPIEKSPSAESCPLPDASNKTESCRELVSDVHIQAQKQNLLKALKAIDVGQEPDNSDSEIEDETVVTFADPSVKHVHVVNELFTGSQSQVERNQNFKYKFSRMNGISAED